MLMEEAEVSLTGLSFPPVTSPFIDSYVQSFRQLSTVSHLILAHLPISEKQQHGKVLSKSLVETVAHGWVDLGNAHEMGEGDPRYLPPGDGGHLGA